MTTNKPTQEERKRRFLEIYPLFNQIEGTCKAMAMGKHTFYNWLKEDGEFKHAWHTIKKEAEDNLLQEHLDNIRNIAFDTKVPPQTRLLASFFEVKKLDPNYRDRVEAPRIVGDITIKLAIPEYEERLRLTEGTKEGSQEDATE